MAFPEGVASRQGGLSKGVPLYIKIRISIKTSFQASIMFFPVLEFKIYPQYSDMNTKENISNSSLHNVFLY